MAVPEWLFGPAGDLRPLPSPEMNVVNTVQRFGGVHNAINGARTVDVLGHRANYEFDLKHLDPEEYYWLEALYTEAIPGPFWLIEPLRKNLFSRETALGRPADASHRGIVAENGSTGNWTRVVDGPVDWNQRAFEWTGLTNDTTNGTYLKIDHGPRIPHRDGVPLTISAYLKPSEQVTLYWQARNYASDGTRLADTSGTDTIFSPGVWARFDILMPEPPAGTVEHEIDLWYRPDTGAISSTTVLVMNPQAEYTDTPTEAASGGGSLKAVIDTMDTVSPYFPLQSVSLKILEV